MRTTMCTVAALAVGTAWWVVAGVPAGQAGLADAPEPAATPFAAEDERLVVHEWGTFTSFSGSDGVRLEFRPLVDNDLPYFVVDRARQAGIVNPFLKSSYFAVQRMETPVTYFYTNRERKVRVKVGFPQGLLTEFYPPVATMKPEMKLALTADGNPDPFGAWLVQGQRAPQPVLKDSELDWGEITLIPERQLAPHVDDEQANAAVQWHLRNTLLEQGPGHYVYARETDAAYVHVHRPFNGNRNVPSGNFFEKFLFYRGIGNFELPLSLEAHGHDRFLLTNTGPDEMRSLFLVSVDGESFRFAKYDRIAANGSLELEQTETTGTPEELARAVVAALVAEGLYEKEALAMVKTWQDSWFGEQGTRLFYTLPERLTNELIPLNVEPKPDETIRVLVGRMEVMTPEAEQRITKIVATNLERRTATLAANGSSPPVSEELLALGRLAEPALARVQYADRDPRLQDEARTLLFELRAHRDRVAARSEVELKPQDEPQPEDEAKTKSDD